MLPLERGHLIEGALIKFLACKGQGEHLFEGAVIGSFMVYLLAIIFIDIK